MQCNLGHEYAAMFAGWLIGVVQAMCVAGWLSDRRAAKGE